MRVLITGSSGFLGQNMIPYLVARNYDVHQLQSDLRDHAEVEYEVGEIRPKMVLHFGARTEVEKSFYEPVSFSEVNYVGTVNLVESLIRTRTVNKFLFASTMEVYGWQQESDDVLNGLSPSAIYSEAYPEPHPNAPYAVAKRACELYLQYAGRSYQFPYTIIRQTNTYGRTDNDFFVIERIISQMVQGLPEINLGDPRPYRNFLHVDDLMRLWAILVGAEPDKIRNQIFCTGPNNTISIEKLTEYLASAIGWTGKINWYTRPERPGEIFYLNSSSTRAESILGWKPEISLQEGLKRSINFWRDKYGTQI